MLTLNEDCVREILNYLKIEELSAISKTCKHLYELVSYEVRCWFPKKYACLSMLNNEIVLLPKEREVQYLGTMFNNIIIHGEGRNMPLNDNLVRFTANYCSPRMLRLEMVLLQGDQLAFMNKTFESVETLILYDCGLSDDFYDCLLQKCPLLKHLIISDSDVFVEPASNTWLSMKYPHLESVQLSSAAMISFQPECWIMFFSQNPQIQRFSCDLWCLDNLIDRPIQIIHRNATNLTHLYISMRGIGHLNVTYDDLLVFCQEETFQCLELQFSGSSGAENLIKYSEFIGHMGPKLQGIHLTDMYVGDKIADTIGKFVDLKRIYFTSTMIHSKFEDILSTKLQNLEEIYLEQKNPGSFLEEQGKGQRIYSSVKISSTFLTAYAESRHRFGLVGVKKSREYDTDTPVNDEHLLLKVRNTFNLPN